MSEGQIVPTQTVLLELKEERASLREGYRFLDEKRLILAAEMLAELGRYEEEGHCFDTAYAQAAAALEAAVARHGLDELYLYPARTREERCPLEQRKVLGVALYEARVEEDTEAAPGATVVASPEAERCRAAFADLIPRVARLAALAANLERLRADYARTARRARALEDVLLPESAASIKLIETALEELEREETVRTPRSRA